MASAKFQLFCIALFGLSISASAQVKIGDDVSTIHESSILELESSSKVLVVTRMTNAQMYALNPLAGGMVYNTDTACIHSYNGSVWISLCDSNSGSFSFMDNNDGTFSVNYADGTTFTSSDLTGPQGEKGDTGAPGPQGPAGADGAGTASQQEQIVIRANSGQTRFSTPLPIVDDKKIEVYRNGVRIAFTSIDANTIELESEIICYQNDSIRIVQIF